MDSDLARSPEQSTIDPEDVEFEYVDDVIPSPSLNPHQHTTAPLNNCPGYYAADDQQTGDIVIPQELIKNITILSCETRGNKDCAVFLIGTAHVSQESCNEVQAVISYLKPEAVFLELCSSRIAVLFPQDLKIPTFTEMINMWKKKHNIFGILYGWFLAKVASKLEVLPGSEFRVAFEEARKYGGRVILGDRPINITLRRTWGMMPFLHKVKFIFTILSQAIFLPSIDSINNMFKEMDDMDAITLVIQEMSKKFPTLMLTLVEERDLYMATTLFKLAKEHNSVVAVVGKGHVQGITDNWQVPILVNEFKELITVPPHRSCLPLLKVFTCVGILVTGTAVVLVTILRKR